MRLSTILAAAFACGLCADPVARAEEKAEENSCMKLTVDGGAVESPFLGRGCRPRLHRYFVADKDAPVFDGAEGEARIGAISMGTVYFGLEETAERVRLATYMTGDEGRPSPVGWADKENLLENRYRALSLGDARERGLSTRIGMTEGVVRESDGLHLRVVTQPDRRTPISKVPGGEADERVFSWRWYYPFDTEVIDGKVWALLSRKPMVFSAHEVLLATGRDDFQRAFAGWAPLDEMTIWATQLALEVNTAPDAVEARRRSPATVYATNRDDGAPMWVEPWEEWYDPSPERG